MSAPTTGTPVPSTPATGSSGAKRVPRRTPVRVPELDHLDLDGLRAYRAELAEEENLVSYWRRILQARLDLLLSADDDRGAVERLRSVLGGNSAQTRRSSLLSTLPLGDTAPLPDLQSLWEAHTGDPHEIAALVRRITEAEAQLSTYRTALHIRLDLATRELIARYHDDPSSCLVALPLTLPPTPA